MKKFSLISLGCPKNLVDSERFCYIADRNGYKYSDDIHELDLFLINTCSFIQDAIKELKHVLKDVVQAKQCGDVKKVYVSGCIMRRYLQQMQNLFPEVDVWIDLKDFKEFERLISDNQLSDYRRMSLTEGIYAYLRISDGCNNSCSYCTIPSIRGKLRSTEPQLLINEAKELASGGPKELIIIAQDTSAYGLDLYNKQKLPELLKKLHDIKGFTWIRLMYLHPKHISDELIKTIAILPRVLHSFEIPLQHCNDKILKTMNRGYSQADIIELFSKILQAMPDSVFRTTFITGLPGESRIEFNELLRFVENNKFLRMGAFAYSTELGTPASLMKNIVTKQTAYKRKDELLALHRELTGGYLSDFIGKEIEVIIEDVNHHENTSIGRAWFDAPEIDGVVQISGSNARIGEIVKVTIDDALDIDLFGTLTKNY